MNRKRVQRLYREDRPTVRRQGGRKRAMGTRRLFETPLEPALEPGLRIRPDDRQAGFRVLTVTDSCTRECLALVADTFLSGARVARGPDDIIRQRGRPGMIVSDNGTQYASNAILDWSDETSVG